MKKFGSPVPPLNFASFSTAEQTGIITPSPRDVPPTDQLSDRLSVDFESFLLESAAMLTRRTNFFEDEPLSDQDSLCNFLADLNPAQSRNESLLMAIEDYRSHELRSKKIRNKELLSKIAQELQNFLEIHCSGRDVYSLVGDLKKAIVSKRLGDQQTVDGSFLPAMNVNQLRAYTSQLENEFRNLEDKYEMCVLEQSMNEARFIEQSYLEHRIDELMSQLELAKQQSLESKAKIVSFVIPEETSPKAKILDKRRTQTPEPRRSYVPEEESSIEALEHELQILKDAYKLTQSERLKIRIDSIDAKILSLKTMAAICKTTKHTNTVTQAVEHVTVNMPKTPLPRKAKRQSRSQRWSVTYMKDLLNESGVKYTPRKTLPVRIRDRKSGHKCQIAKKVRSNKFEFEDFAAAAKEFSFTNI